jgi:hypothetical protein
MNSSVLSGRGLSYETECWGEDICSQRRRLIARNQLDYDEQKLESLFSV